MNRLTVWVGDARVGWLGFESATDRFSFDYDPQWVAATRSYAISPAIPFEAPVERTPETHSADVRQFFGNLLPEGKALEDAARSIGVSQSNTFALALSLGGETAGALRLLGENQSPAAASASDLRAVSREELSARIRARPEMPFSVWDGRVRLSIAGYQDKIAVYERDGNWYLVNGGPLASTWILKPPPVAAALTSLPHNEFVCMRLAQSAGLAAAPTRLERVPEPVLLVDRFDRVEDGSRIRRVHIIDGCQALGISVGMKYERNHGASEHVKHVRDGVSFPKLFALSARLSVAPAQDRQRLLEWAIYQVLVGNSDGHGKNVSFFVESSGLRVAPMYDLICTEALGVDTATIDTDFAMAIGDAFTQEDLSPYEWANFAEACGLSRALVARQIVDIAGRVLKEMPGSMAQAHADGADPAVSQAVADVVTRNCQRQLDKAQTITRVSKSLVAR